MTVEFKGITKSFNGKNIIDNLSLSVDKGEVLGIIGRSGSGKSTLIKILLGVYKIDSGKIFYDGKDVTNNQQKIARIFGITTQENSFYENLTILENISYYSKIYSVRPDAEKILRSVGLWEHKDKLAKAISGGMKRRLDFAISILHEPKVLILDEPTTGLDPILVKQFWQVVREMKKDKTIIVISHILEELIENCSRIAVLDKGDIKTIMKVKTEMKSKLIEALQ